MEIIHGVPCIKGEIHSLITLMRLNTRWSTRNSTRRSSRENPHYEDDDKLIQSFRRLNEYLEGLFDLHEVDCVNYIKPFHDVIVSLEANAQLTSAALSALSKFALYGFFNSRFPNIKEAMSLVADCIAHCEFEETDWESDELILMKLLELSALSFRCNAADELTVHSAWEIYCTCISIHNHYRASKILKSEAETALVHLTLSIFNRANSLTTRLKALSILAPNDSVVSLEITMGEYTQDTLLSSQTGLVVMLLKVMRVLAEMLEAPKQTPEHIKFSLFLINVALEAGGTALNYIPSVVTLLSDDICRHLLRSSQSDDLGVFSSSLRVVFNLFMSIKDHMKVQLEVFLSSVHLRLLSMNNSSAAAKEELVLESLLDFCREPSLMHDLYANYDCDVQCSNLFDIIIETLCKKVLMNVEDEVSAETSGKERKIQPGAVDSVVSRAQAISRLQEGLLAPKRLSIIHRLTFDGIIAVLHAVVGKFDLLHYSDHNVRTGSMCEATEENVESQVDKWCDSGPEYECMSVDDFEVLQYADSGAPSSPQVQKVTSSSPFVFVKDNQSVTSEEGEGASQGSVTSLVDKENELTGAMLEARQKAIETLRQRKMMKQKLRWIVEEFNQRPVKTEWLRYAVDAGIVASVKVEEALVKPSGTVSSNTTTDIYSIADPHSTAAFLKSTTGLGKAQVGEFISKGPVHLFPFNQKVLKEYLGTFDFKGEHGAFDKAMRLFLSAFRLPGEAQCIDRIMEAFATRYYQQLGEESPFASADAAYVLSFSTIMLNTDLHNPQIVASKRMTKDEFVRNNRGINDGKDLPKEYLISLYDEIKAKQIQVDIDVSDAKANTHVDVTDPTVWNKLINRQQHSNPPSFTPTNAARKQSLTRGALLNHAALSSRRDSYLLTTYEEDMFFTMCKPIYEAIVKLWDQTLDDVWVARLLQGILQMFAACVKLNLNYLYCRMSRAMLVNACQWMAKSRGMTSKPFARTNILASRNSYEQWKGEGDHDLLLLASLAPEQLVFNSGITEKLDFSEMAMIKGEVTFKLVLETTLQTASLLDSTSFVVLFVSLLWCRSRGTLPLPLALLNTEYIVAENSSQTLLKARFPPSAAIHSSLLRDELSDATLYYVLASTTSDTVVPSEEVAKSDGLPSQSTANRAATASPYHTNIMNAKSARYPDISTINRAGSNKTQAPQNSGGWMSSISSLLWSNAPDNATPPLNAADTKYTASSLLSTDTPVDKRVGKLEFIRCSKVAGFVSNSLVTLDRQGYPMRPDDMVLATVLNHTDMLCSLLQSEQNGASSADMAMEGLFIVLKCLLRKHIPTIPASSMEGWLGEMGQSPINRMLKATNTGNTQGEQELLTALGVEMPIEEVVDCILQESSELDIVLCLEWISKKMFIGWDKHNNKVFRILKWVLADEVDVILAACPCLVDRCVFFVYQGLLFSLQNKDQGSAWWSLVIHILHLPIDILSAQGGMMVAGVVSVVFSMHNIQWDKAVSSDNWYNLLSLVLLLLTEGPTEKHTYADMRSLIWQMVIYIFTEDMLCAENFDIVKKVVCKLLNRYVIHSRKRRSENVYQDEHLALHAIKELTCIEYAWKLCLFAWSEHVYNGSVLVGAAGSVYSTPNKTRPPALLVTPPRSPKGRDVATNLFNGSPTGDGTNKMDRKMIPFPPPIPSHTPSSKMAESVKVKVMMGVMSKEDASKLLVETVAMLADLCYIESVRVIESCLFGIEQLVGIESAIHLSPETIMSLLEELINRLPQNIVVYTGRQQNSLSYSEIVAVCLRGCNIIFTIFTRYTRVLVSLPHYSSLYIRAVSALVTNASVSPRLQPTHEEMMAMAVALLKLLRIPSQSQTDMRVAAERKAGIDLPTSPNPKSQADTQASGGFSLWGFLGFSAPSSPVPNPTVSHTPTQPVLQPNNADHLPVLNEPNAASASVPAAGHDQELVCLAWKTASSLYSLFPGLVKSKEPQLHAAITHCVDNPIVDVTSFQSPVAKGTLRRDNANVQQAGTSTPVQTQASSAVKSARKPLSSPAVAQSANRSASKVQIV